MQMTPYEELVSSMAQRSASRPVTRSVQDAPKAIRAIELRVSALESAAGMGPVASYRSNPNADDAAGTLQDQMNELLALLSGIDERLSVMEKREADRQKRSDAQKASAKRKDETHGPEVLPES